MLEFPHDRRSAILEAFPETGLAWLDAYPELLQDCLDHWQVSITGTNTSGLAINMIYFVETRSREQKVLKIGHPHPEQRTEMLALKHFDGHFSVRLLDVYREAILLDCIVPGTTLRAETPNSKQALSVFSLFADLPKSMRKDETRHFPTYKDWMIKAFSEYRNGKRESDLIGKLLNEAEKLYCEIDSGEYYLLHGDLHHDNILFTEKNTWIAIDPKGVVGPKIMECGRYIHNFMEDVFNKEISEIELADLLKIMAHRIHLISKVTCYQIDDLAKVAFVDITLSTCWTINAGGDARNGLHRLNACFELLTFVQRKI